MARERNTPDETPGEPSTEIVVIDNPETALAALIRGEMVEASDPQVIAEAIARRILFAETEADAFADVSTWSSKENVGREYEVHDCVVLRSTFGDGQSGFLAIQATDLETGEIGVLTSSATKIGAKLLWLRLHDAFPRKVRIIQAERASSNGFYPLDIETVD